LDGFLGLYRGLGFQLAYRLIQWYTINRFLNKYLFDNPDILKMEEEADVNPVFFNHENMEYHICRTFHEVMAVTLGCIVSHPFYMLSVRSMAQFVGREEQYRLGWEYNMADSGFLVFLSLSYLYPILILIFAVEY
jgi:carrier protein